MSEVDKREVEGETAVPSLADLGIKAASSTQKTVLGKAKVWRRLSLWEKLFLLLSLVSFLTTLGLTIERLAVLPSRNSNFIFALVLLINIIFCLYYAVNGVFRERKFELYAFIAGAAIILFYVILEFIINPKRTGYKIARLATICVLAPVDIVLGWKVATEFGWLQFNIVGASTTLLQAYKMVCRFSALLNFDLQLQISLLILIVTDFDAPLSELEKVVVGLGCAIAITMFIVGQLAMQIESVILVYLFMFLSVFEPGYIIFKFAKIIIFTMYQVVPDGGAAPILNISVFVVGISALAVRVALMLFMIAVYNNFHKGLKGKTFDCCNTTE